MGFQLSKSGLDKVIRELSSQYDVYAPKVFEGGGRYSDTDMIRYGKVTSVSEIEMEKKSEFSYKEILLPVSQTLFYFTENEMKEAEDAPKGALVFLRSCDLHAVKRLDDMYLHNGPEDYYYKRLRDKIKFVLMGCSTSFDNCFCVSMGTNQSENYDMSIDYLPEEECYRVDCKEVKWMTLLEENSAKKENVTPFYVTENPVKVHVPENLNENVGKSKMWEEYDGRCINCGRCNFVCPTCTCFTMQDMFYSENRNAGERRRVWASCMVDGFTDVAGGGSYRQKNGQRMRFKVLHKVYDYKLRNGYHMCVGCGRCDDVCPEYISFSNCINKLESAMEEVTASES